MRSKTPVIVLLLSWLALTQQSWGQRSPNWRAFKLGDGLPESACNSVVLSPQGKILVQHPSLTVLSELDGYSVNVISTSDKPRGRICQSPGGQLWALSSDGLREAKEGSWVSHIVPEIAAQMRGNASLAVPLFAVRQGLVLFLLPDRLEQFSSEHAGPPRIDVLREASAAGLGKFTGMTAAADGGIWISGSQGLARIPNPRASRSEAEWQVFPCTSDLNVSGLREPHVDAAGFVSMVGETVPSGEPVAVFFDGKSWKRHAVGKEKLLHAWRGPENSYWAITKDSLLQWSEEEAAASENEEVSARQYFDVALEPSGAFWLATSDGLFRYAPSIWRTPPAARPIRSMIHGLSADRDGRVWFLAGNALHVVSRELRREFAFPSNLGRRLVDPNAIFCCTNGAVLIESEGELFGFQEATGFFEASGPPGPGERFKVLGSLANGTWCVQKIAEDSTGADHPLQLQAFDGAMLRPYKGPALEPGVGTRLSALFTTKGGDLWVSGEKGVACLHEDKWRLFTSTDRSTPESAIAFVELPDGRTCCATSDNIWEFDGRNWVAVRRGFDRVAALTRTRDGSVWVASSGGLHRWFQGEWIENGTEEGLASSSVRGLCEDQSGKLWAATTHGLDWYCPEADGDPPRTAIETFSEEERNLAEGQAFSIAFSGLDKWKYTSKTRLFFSYRLDQGEWSPFQELARAGFSELPAGKHYFQVRAMDRNCNIDPKPPQFEFAVVLPWYREKRLVLISTAGAAAVLFFAGLAFNRHRRLLRGYAEIEKKVAQRTDELEIANRELLHSQKMNALGTLAAGIAHDFNNILSIIKGSAQIIEENVEDGQKVRTRVERIKTVVEQGAGIVKAMLGFSRDTDEPASLCDINEAVEDTMKLLGDRFLREVEVSVKGAQGLPPVRCSKDFIQQILLNFIFNAAESMKKNKQITITTAASETVPPGMALMPVLAPGYQIISVEDCGCGIPPENLSRIFEPFFTTKAFSSRRGTGLGLSMVYELARKMDAGLAVVSVVEQGSKFSLVLPVRDQGGPEVSSSKVSRSEAEELSSLRS